MDGAPLPAPYQNPHWQQELDRIAPGDGGDGVLLHLYWEEGYPWEPINRWMIGTVNTRVPDFFREALEGPDPRTQGHYDEVLKVFKTSAACSRRQWDYYQHTGHHLETYWVCQGSRGGHRYVFNQTEGRLAVMNGYDAQPPRPGDLGYITPNEITFDALRNIRALFVDQAIIEDKENQILAANEREGLVELRRAVWNWLSDGLEESCDELAFALKSDMHMAPDGDSNAINKGLEEVEESFITEGVD